MIFDVSPDDLDFAARSIYGDGFQVVTGNASKLQFIEFMPKKATDPLADRRVRQALNHAVNVEAIVTNLYKGLGTRQSSPIMTGALVFDPSLADLDYNPTFAKQLLADAGYPNGFSATMDLASSDNPSEALAVIGQLQQVGVTVPAQNAGGGRRSTPTGVRTSPAISASPGWGGLQDPAVFLNFTTLCGSVPGRLVHPVIQGPHRARQASRHVAGPGRARRPVHPDRAPLLRDNPMGIYLANDVQHLRHRPPRQRLAQTYRPGLIPTNITLQQ